MEPHSNALATRLQFPSAAGIALIAVVGIEQLPAQQASDRPPLALPRIAGPITLDGRLDEVGWQRIAPLPLVGFEPIAGQAPTQPTAIRVGYDDAFLYIGAELLDARGPVTNTFTRDRWANDDLLEIVLDTYNDNENAVIFGVNPAGTRFDSQVRDDAEFTFGFPVDNSWNAFWDASARRSPTGWTAEVRIPFSTLRFQPREGRVTMGMIVSRYIARNNETVTFPTIDPRWNMGFNKPSQAQDILLENVGVTRPVYVAPYVLAGDQTTRTPDASAGGTPRVISRSSREIGGDVRFALVDNMSVDLTVNTDFAQVEADDQQVNLTRFSLFYPEKRQFFQERSGIFEFRTGGNNRLFHSRRIGIADDGGGITPIAGGGRLVGRAGGWDFGVLDMQTLAEGLTPAENFLVARGRRRIANEYSQVGGMVTSRVAVDAQNIAYGVDGSLRLGSASSRYVTMNWAQSLVDGVAGAASGSGLVTLEDRDRRGLGYRLGASRTGRDFDPGVGFVQRRDYRDVSLLGTWGVFASDSSPLRRWGPRFEGSYLVRDSDGSFETAEWSTAWEAEFKNGASVRGGIVFTRDRLESAFQISDAVSVPAGEHRFAWGRMFAMTSGARLVGGSLFAQVGEFYDGDIVQLSASPRWRIPPFLELAPELDWFRVRFDGRGQAFNATVSRLRTTVSLNAALSADALVQYSSEGSRLVANGRLRYQFAEGRTLWVVLNEQRETLSGAAVSLSPVARDRTLVVKYLHTFRAR